MRSGSRPLLMAMVLVFAVLAVAAGYYVLQSPALGSGLPVNVRLGGPIVLDSTQGGQFDLAHEKGKVVVLTFGYTACPNICPTNLARMARALKSLGTQARAVDVVFISFDPDRDTIGHLKKYVAFFDGRVIGATGTADEIAAVGKRYGVIYQRQQDDAGDYAFDHSDFIYLLDTEGRVRKLYDSQVESAEIATDVSALLRERPFLQRFF